MAQTRTGYRTAQNGYGRGNHSNAGRSSVGLTYIRTGSQTNDNQNRRQNRSDASRQGHAATDYIYDNTARDLDTVRRMEQAPRRISNEARKNREKARHMNLGYMVFLMAALSIAAVIVIHYIQLQSELTTSTRQIDLLESKLNDLKLSNDEEYNRIESSIDLEEIKRVATVELGMVYAGEGQIITYSSVGADYMRKVSDHTN